MDLEKLFNDKSAQLSNQHFIEFTEEEFDQLRVDEAQYIINHYHGHSLMKLPPSEIVFFEWLKKADSTVWNDLWADSEDLYLVSIDLLPQFIDEKNGFPICDLIDEPNYWFSQRHIKPKGQEELIHILIKIQNKEKLKADELFLYELTLYPTDIWHFCHRHHFKVNAMKAVIADMVYHGWLVHLTDREDLIKYLDI